MDTAFVEAFVNFANWKGLIYVSPFWTRYYWAYLNYNQEQSAGAALDMNSSVAEQVLSDATVQFVNAIAKQHAADIYGQAYSGAIATAQLKAVTSVSAAGYGVTVAPSSIVSLFAANIATEVSVATNPPPTPLPISLGGVSATITDISGNASPISLIAVTPSQMNAVLPAGLQAGPAVVNLTTSSGAQITGDATLAAAAPALFSANETGRGTAAAQVVIGHADGSQTFIPAIATCSASGCTPIPINLGSSTDQAYLVLFGTGIRGAGGASAADGDGGQHSLPGGVCGRARHVLWPGPGQRRTAAQPGWIGHGERGDHGGRRDR